MEKQRITEFIETAKQVLDDLDQKNLAFLYSDEATAEGNNVVDKNVSADEFLRSQLCPLSAHIAEPSPALINVGNSLKELSPNVTLKDWVTQADSLFLIVMIDAFPGVFQTLRSSLTDSKNAISVADIPEDEKARQTEILSGQEERLAETLSITAGNKQSVGEEITQIQSIFGVKK